MLGSIESGVDFEKRIADIYQRCRRPEEIEEEFAGLRADLEEKISQEMKQTREKVFENLDAEVHEKLRISKEESKGYLNKYESWLWDLTRHALCDCADFDKNEYAFLLKTNPFPQLRKLPIGPYRMGRNVDRSKDHIYRPGHPVAREIIRSAMAQDLPHAEIKFDYSGWEKKSTAVESLCRQTGILAVHQLTVEALEREDFMVFSGYTDTGRKLSPDQCSRLLTVPGRVEKENIELEFPQAWEHDFESAQASIFKEIEERNSAFFDEEMTKLDKWADDLKKALEADIKNMDREIKQLRREARKKSVLKEKLKVQRRIKDLEKKRNSKRSQLFEEQDKVDDRKESLIGDIEKRLEQKSAIKELFRIRWRVV